MRRMTLAIAALLTLALGLASSPAHAVPWTPEDGDEAFTLGEGWPGGPGWLGITMDGNGFTYILPSRLAGKDKSGTSKPCKSLDSGWCKDRATEVLFYALLPHCTSNGQTWCVDGVAARRGAGDSIKGVPQESFPSSGPGDFAGSPAVNLPQGATSTLWQLPGVEHSGKATTYLSVVAVEGRFQRESPSKPWSGPVLSGSLPGTSGFTAILYPVSIQDGTYVAASIDQGGWEVANWNFGTECAQATNGSCARRYAFPADTRFAMSLRLGASPGPFLHGRLLDPSISIDLEKKTQTITVEAAPAQVPLVASWQKWADLPDYLKDLYPLDFGGMGFTYGNPAWRNDVTKRVMMSVPQGGGAQPMQELSAWLRFLGDKATAVPRVWSFSAVPGAELKGANACFTKGGQVNGLVATNATAYSAGPPSLSKKAGSLDYQVMAPHYTRTGDVFSGAYTLALRSDVARCPYGFTKAPIKATVQVIGNDGEEKAAKVSVLERQGWLTVNATGFDFSKPTIAVTITGKKK